MQGIKTGDTVRILSGKDRGASGKVLHVSKKSGRVTVEAKNLITRHQRPKKQGEKGQKIQVPMPMHPSNLLLVCPHCGKPTRIGQVTDDKGVKTRLCRKCKKRI